MITKRVKEITVIELKPIFDDDNNNNKKKKSLHANA